MVHPPVEIAKALIRTTEQKMPMPDLSHELAELLRLRDLRFVGRMLSVHQPKVLDWTYSRYADDLTFSASGELGTKIGYLLHRVRVIVHDESFIINEFEDKGSKKKRSAAGHRVDRQRQNRRSSQNSAKASSDTASSSILRSGIAKPR